MPARPPKKPADKFNDKGPAKGTNPSIPAADSNPKFKAWLDEHAMNNRAERSHVVVDVIGSLQPREDDTPPPEAPAPKPRRSPL